MGALTIIADVLEVVVLAGATLYLFSHAGASERRSPAVMLGFAYAIMFVSNLYWIAHELMTKEAIYEFSAIDVASAGFYILFGASLSMVVGRRERVDVVALVGSGVVAGAQIGCWVLWAGSWFKNVLGGLPAWYASYYVILAVRDTQATSKVRWSSLMAAALVVVVLQVWGFFSPGEIQPAFDAAGGLVSLAGTVAIDLWLVRSWTAEGASQRTISLAFLAALWSWSAMFLMSDPFYSILLMVSTVQMVVAARAVGGGLVDDDLL